MVITTKSLSINGVTFRIPQIYFKTRPPPSTLYLLVTWVGRTVRDKIMRMFLSTRSSYLLTYLSTLCVVLSTVVHMHNHTRLPLNDVQLKGKAAAAATAMTYSSCGALIHIKTLQVHKKALTSRTSQSDKQRQGLR